MLSIMRKQARGWMIKILLFAISIVFIFWGFSGINTPREDNFVAKVNGESITYNEYRESYGQLRERYRRAYGDINDEIMKSLNLDRQVLDQLVNRTLMLQEAERLNIQVADQMIDQAIIKFPAFQNNGEFDEERAKMVLAQNRISTADLRDSFRKDMIIGQLHIMITEGVVASEAEAKEWYSWYNAEIDLNFILFQPETIKDVSVTEEQMAEFFKLNENDYRTEPQVKVRYIFLDPADYKEQVEIGPNQVAEYYHRHPEEFRFEKTIEARHILLKLDENADSQTVDNKKKEAMKIYKMALDGRSFPELAKKYSDGPTRGEGGYLGEFKREAMVKPFGDKAFSMQAGEISEPVRTRFGWHIIKVEKVNDARTLSVEEAASTIREKLVAEKARASALKQAEEIYDSALFVGVNLADLAQARGLAVKTTDFFDLQGPAASEIEDRQSFAQAAFGLDGTTVSDVRDIGDGFYLLQLVDRTDSSVPPLESVKDRVEQDLVASIRVERAKSDAEAFLAELRKGKSMAEAGKALGAQHEQTGFFKRTDSIPKIGYEQAILQAAFELGSENKLPDQVFQGQQGWYVIELRERIIPPIEGFEKERDGIVKRVTDQKKQSTIEQWLADLKERGQIQINHNLIQ